MQQMKYIGPNYLLYGKTALVREAVMSKGEPEGYWMVQFDFFPPLLREDGKGSALNYLCFGWHPFEKSCFEVINAQG